MSSTKQKKPPVEVFTKPEWSDPPTQTRGRAVSEKWQAVADELRSHPGQWAKIAENASPSIASSINKGGYRSFRPKGSFQAVSRSDGENGFNVWAVYVGEQSQSESDVDPTGEEA